MTHTKVTGAENIKWDLRDLFDSIDSPKILEGMEKTKKEACEFENKYKGKLAQQSSESLLEAFETLERIIKPEYKIGQYVQLVYSIDTSCDKVKALMSQVDQIGSEVSNHFVFFDLELAQVSKEKYQEFLNSDCLSEYKYSLSLTKKTAKYNLTEKEEQVINLKDITGESAFKKLYSDLTSSFEFEFEIDGKLKKMNGSELRALRHNPDPKIRRSAMKTFFKSYEENSLVLSQCYNNIVKDQSIEKNLRGYKNAISIRNVGSDLEDTAVEVLHDTTTESYKLVHRYYKLKAKIMDIPDMTLADIYAPMPEANKVYTWDMAKNLVLEGFAAFDEDIYKKAKSMFDENKIHAPVAPTKRGGAYCSSSIPELKPYVLLNFLGKPRDVATLAHELGHAIHDMYCAKQNLTNYHPILPLAETASIFSEMIITDLLLKNETDKQVKQVLICDKLEDIFASSHRQNMFSRFEINSHKKIDKKIMSTPELCKLYTEELKLMFGESVKITDEYKWEWASIPHIYESPFYVYAYNFANLLVIALYEKYLEEGESFIPKYKEFLSLGSAASPLDITATVNADITDPNFWHKSLNYIERLIDQLEEIVNN
jgi:oligoendopeptidase F